MLFSLFVIDTSKQIRKQNHQFSYQLKSQVVNLRLRKATNTKFSLNCTSLLSVKLNHLKMEENKSSDLPAYVPLQRLERSHTVSEDSGGSKQRRHRRPPKISRSKTLAEEEPIPEEDETEASSPKLVQRKNTFDRIDTVKLRKYSIQPQLEVIRDKDERERGDTEEGQRQRKTSNVLGRKLSRKLSGNFKKVMSQGKNDTLRESVEISDAIL